jgi:hypothetical protein
MGRFYQAFLCYVYGMKFPILAIFLASVCCFVIPINGQTTSKNPDTDKKHSRNAEQPKIDTVNVDTVNVVKLNEPQQTEPQRKADDNSKESPSYFRRLIAPESLPNLILCVVGIAGVIAAVWTLRAIQEQVTLQKTAMKQWLDFPSWTHRPQQLRDGSWGMNVIVDIVNPTDWPLKLEVTKLRWPVDSWMTHTALLSPKVPYTVELGTFPCDYEQYLARGITFRVVGFLSFEDCFGQSRKQVFSGRLECGGGGTKFQMMHFPEQPYQEEEQQAHGQAN